MADEDFYIENSNPVKVFFTCLFILFFIGALAGAYYYFYIYNNISLRNIAIELGEKIPGDIAAYVKRGSYQGWNLDTSLVHLDENGNTDSAGEYGYKVTKDDKVLKGKVIVKDTTPPTVEVGELIVGVNENFSVDEFIIKCDDLSGACFPEYSDDKQEEYVKEEGTYEIVLRITDKYDNEIIKKTKLTVSKNVSLSDMKASDQTVASVYPIDKNWDQTFTIKFDKGIKDESDKFEKSVLEIANRDFQKDYEEEIIEQYLLTIYNKYNYVLGFSVKLELENGKVIYVIE